MAVRYVGEFDVSKLVWSGVVRCGPAGLLTVRFRPPTVGIQPQRRGLWVAKQLGS